MSFFVLTGLIYLGCSSDPANEEPIPDPVSLSVTGAEVIENDGVVINFEIRASRNTTESIEIDYEVTGITAEPSIDFSVASTGTVVLESGTNRVSVPVQVLNDDILEVNEELTFTMTNARGADISSPTALGIIKDNDSRTNFDDEGYLTPDNHYGYQMMWGESFDNPTLDPSSFNFEVGDGCPNLCGWGNNELQTYSSEEDNVFIEDSKLVIRATEVAGSTYRSARLTTKDKKEFQFGRIDIRARMPIGQGIWPALWMLGQNIDEIGWPACGEIDIMEMVGHQPKNVHGTAHWGPTDRGFSTFKTAQTIHSDDLADNFHVYTLVWKMNRLEWYFDEKLFHTITPTDLQGEANPFNQPFFFIFNIAVGGNWPGNPDSTTEFPQRLEVDYIRVFQRT